MPIRVVCQNCAKQFTAWDDLVGKTVQCPKCQHRMVLGGSNPALDKPASPDAPLGESGKLGEPSPGKGGGSRSSRDAVKLEAQAPSRSAERTFETPSRSTPPGPRPSERQPVPSAELPRTASPQVRPVGSSTQRPRPPVIDSDESLPVGCPNCNAKMEPNDDLCDACGYHLILKKVIDISDLKKANRATGFERLLQDQLHETESSQSTLLLLKIVGAVLLLAVMFMCLGKWFWIGVLVVGAVVAYYYLTYKGRTTEAGSDGSVVNQDPVSAALWNLLLVVERTLGWRKLEWPFPRTACLALRDQSFGDEDLGELQGLADLEALDLEATGVTDEGLQHLRDSKRLHFLVLRRTQVTASGVRRLQKDLPQALIWH